jgi:hypothetical protein
LSAPLWRLEWGVTALAELEVGPRLTEVSRQPYRVFIQKICGTLSCTIDFSTVEGGRRDVQITNVSCEARLSSNSARLLEWTLYVLAVPERFIRGVFALPPTLGGSDATDSYLMTNEQVFAVLSRGQMPSVNARASPSTVVEFMRCTIVGHLVRYE